MSIFSSETFDEFVFGLRDIYRYRMKGVKKIHLAVIGGPSSGKSYLISDIVKALSKMGIKDYGLGIKGAALKNLSDFDPDNIKEGRMKGTPVYACRLENHYGTGASITGLKEFDMDFLNIPGEAFNDSKTIQLYFAICKKLYGREGRKLFKMVTWRSSGDKEVFVIEPRNPIDKIAERINEGKRENDMYVDPEARREQFLGWSDIFSELKDQGCYETKKVKNVSGRYVLDNLLRLNVDSVMASIGEICKDFKIEGLKGREDFENIAREFYFLHYCKNATDIVLCDKILLPKESEKEEILPFANICAAVKQFYTIEKGNHPHIYMSFRGIDFLLHGTEDNYRRLGKHINDSFERRMNAQYSLFSYLLWHHVNENVVLETPEEFEKAIGFKINNVDVDELTKKFLNMDFSSIARVADGGTVKSVINTHIGARGMVFRGLLEFAYPNLDFSHTYNTLDNVVPHVYFSATPITSDFKLYVNDPKSGFQRFINENEPGGAKYFDLVGDHLCFGSYQLCMDILMQNKVYSQYEYGDLLDRCMQS